MLKTSNSTIRLHEDPGVPVRLDGNRVSWRASLNFAAEHIVLFKFGYSLNGIKNDIDKGLLNKHKEGEHEKWNQKRTLNYMPKKRGEQITRILVVRPVLGVIPAWSGLSVGETWKKYCRIQIEMEKIQRSLNLGFLGFFMNRFASHVSHISLYSSP